MTGSAADGKIVARQRRAEAGADEEQQCGAAGRQETASGQAQGMPGMPRATTRRAWGSTGCKYGSKASRICSAACWAHLHPGLTVARGPPQAPEGRKNRQGGFFKAGAGNRQVLGGRGWHAAGAGSARLATSSSAGLARLACIERAARRAGHAFRAGSEHGAAAGVREAHGLSARPAVPPQRRYHPHCPAVLTLPLERTFQPRTQKADSQPAAPWCSPCPSG